MKIVIDTDSNKLFLQNEQGERAIDLYTDESFDIISEQWLKLSWNQKYSYTFTWFGRPVIQLPEDLIRIQEIIYRVKPDVIVETGVAHGGSLIFYASLCKAMGHGRIVGIDIEIRPHNRSAIEGHELASSIMLIEGSSTSSEVITKVRSLIQPGERVLVLLDSNHTRQHVLDELRLYADFVSVGSYLVATDGIMKNLIGVPRANTDWITDNPQTAVAEFLSENSNFTNEDIPFVFNESTLARKLTYWPGGFIKRIR